MVQDRAVPRVDVVFIPLVFEPPHFFTFLLIVTVVAFSEGKQGDTFAHP